MDHSAVAIRRWGIDVACFDHSITFDRRSNQNCQQFLASSQQLSGKQAIFHDFLPFEKMQNGHWNHALSSSSGPSERTYRAQIKIEIDVCTAKFKNEEILLLRTVFFIFSWAKL